MLHSDTAGQATLASEDGGFDTAEFTDIRANYIVSAAAGGRFTVAHVVNGRIDTTDIVVLEGIELLRFADQTIVSPAALAVLEAAGPIPSEADGEASATAQTPAPVPAAAPPTDDGFAIFEFDALDFQHIIRRLKVEAGDRTDALAPELAPVSVGLHSDDTPPRIDTAPPLEAHDVEVPVGSGTLIVGDARDNRLTGGSGNDVLIGGDGDDIIDGGRGADTMVGGRGDDIYFVDDVGDAVIETAGEDQGRDTVIVAVDGYRLADNVEVGLIAAGSRGLSLSGNALDNMLSGADGDDFVFAASGHDRLSGAGGRDVLAGGAGDDFLDGGLGDDFMDGGEDFDTAVFAKAFALYEVLRDAGGIKVRDLDTNETDTLVNIERGHFKDYDLLL